MDEFSEKASAEVLKGVSPVIAKLLIIAIVVVMLRKMLSRIKNENIRETIISIVVLFLGLFLLLN